MNKSELKQVCLAMMFGDAFVDSNANSGKSRLEIYHKADHAEWLLLKQQWLNQISGVRTCVSEKRDGRLLLSGETRRGLRLQTTYHRYFYSLSVAPEKFQLKQLVKPLALATLWQDDGTVCYDRHGYFSTAYLCTDSWSESFVRRFHHHFNQQYGWSPVVMLYRCRGTQTYRLRFRKAEFEKLSRIIKSYVVPCMTYKISP